MVKKVLNTIFVLSMVIGFIIVAGTAGSSDLGLIDLKTLVVHGIVGVAFMLFGFTGFKICDLELMD